MSTFTNVINYGTLFYSWYCTLLNYLFLVIKIWTILFISIRIKHTKRIFKTNITFYVAFYNNFDFFSTFSKNWKSHSLEFDKKFLLTNAVIQWCQLSPFWSAFNAKRMFSPKLKNTQFQRFSVFLFSPFGPFFLQICMAILSYASLAMSYCKPIWQEFFLLFLVVFFVIYMELTNVPMNKYLCYF